MLSLHRVSTLVTLVVEEDSNIQVKVGKPVKALTTK